MAVSLGGEEFRGKKRKKGGKEEGKVKKVNSSKKEGNPCFVSLFNRGAYDFQKSPQKKVKNFKKWGEFSGWP